MLFNDIIGQQEVKTQLLELVQGIVSRLEHYDESLADVREILTGLFDEGMEF